MAWDDEKLAELKRLSEIEPALSNRNIAAKLSKAFPGFYPTRNAVIGKRLRTGIKATRPRGIRDEMGPRKRKRKPFAGQTSPQMRAVHNARAKISLPALPLPAEDPIDPTSGKSIMELGPQDCRWIHGDPATGLYSYCGAASVDKLPYCPDHAARAYRPV